MKYMLPFITIVLFSSVLIAGASNLKLTCYMKPCELKGDFDGDGKIDGAILVEDEKGKKGILFNLSKAGIKSIGAGRNFGNGGDNFDWMDHWAIHKGPIKQGSDAAKPPKAKGDSLLLEKTASASGIAYWTGSEFQWYQQGD